MNEFDAEMPRSAIAHARVSTGKQAEFAIDRQIEQIYAFAKSKNIEIVGEERLEGVSGLREDACFDVDRIIQRKIERNDFDAVILADVDRLTRAGVTHAFHIMHRMNAVNIRVIFARDDIPQGPYGWLFFAMKCAEANADIKVITKRMLEGWLKAADGKRVTHSSKAPYGCDKLVSSAAGVSLFRVRRCQDGSYKILDPQKDETLRVITKSDARATLSFKTQPSDLMTLVPGDPEIVDVIREIFALRFGPEGLGEFKIALHLNSKGVPSRSGGPWTKSMIKNILSHSCYFGVGVGNVWSNAKLLMRGIGATGVNPLPALAVAPRSSLSASRKRFQYRSPDEWRRFKYESMADFFSNLEPEVRERALQFQLASLQRYSENRRAGRKPAVNVAGRKSGGSRHHRSDYLLSDLLRCAIDNYRYFGQPGRLTRYYIHTGRRNKPMPGLRIPYLPAELLEPAVLNAVKDVVKNAPYLRKQIVESINEVKKKRSELDPKHMERLKAKEQKLLTKIEKTTDIHWDMKPQHLNSVLDPMKRELRSVTADLAEADAAAARFAVSDIDVKATADRVMSKLEAMLSGAAARDEHTNVRLKALLKLLVKKLTIHPETFAIEMVVGVPSWFAEECSVLKTGGVRPVGQSPGASTHEKTGKWIDISRFEGRLIKTSSASKSRWKTIVLRRSA